MNNQSLNKWQPLTIKPPENECLILTGKDFNSFVFSASNQIRIWFEDNSYEPYAIPYIFEARVIMDGMFWWKIL